MLNLPPLQTANALQFQGRKPYPENIAHRGAQIEKTGADTYSVYCENSLEALVRAAEMGIEAIELDIIAVQDEHGNPRLLVHHDDKWGRLYKQPGGQKLLKKSGFADSRKAEYRPEGLRKALRPRIGNADDSRVQWNDSPAPKVSTLEEVVDAVLAVKPDMKFYFEAKTKNWKIPVGSKKLEKTLVQFINDRQLHKQATVISFNPWSLAKVKRLDPAIQTGLDLSAALTSRIKDKHLPRLMQGIKKLVKADAVMPAFEENSDAFMQAARQAELKVRPYVRHENLEQEKEAWAKLVEQGVDGIVTNAPGELRAFLNTLKNTEN